MSLADASEKLKVWRKYYNEDRPHSAIGYTVPIDMHYPDGASSQSSSSAGKFQLPAVQGWGEAHKPADSGYK